MPLRVQLDVEHALRDGPALAGAGKAGVLDGVFQDRTAHAAGARVAFVDQDRAAAEQITMAFQGQVQRGIEQGMAWAHKSRQRLALGAISSFSNAMRS